MGFAASGCTFVTIVASRNASAIASRDFSVVVPLEALQIPLALFIAITVSFTGITIIVVAAFFVSQSQRGCVDCGRRRRDFGSTVVDLPFVGMVNPSVFASGSKDELFGLWVVKLVGHAGV